MVLPYVDLRLHELPELADVVAQGRRAVLQPYDPVREEVEIPLARLAEEAVLVLLELLPEVDELLVEELKLVERAACGAELGRKVLDLPGEYPLLHGIQLLLEVLEHPEVRLDDSLEQIVDEALEPRLAPAPRAHYLLGKLQSKAFIVYYRYTLFVQREGEKVPSGGRLLPLRGEDPAGQRVEADDRARLGAVAQVELDVHGHVEQRLLLFPLGGAHEGGVLFTSAHQLSL